MERERVILIKGSNSNWYEQAIFIVKRDAAPDKIPVDFVLEAEKIISGYMMKNKICTNKAAQKYAQQPPSKTRQTQTAVYTGGARPAQTTAVRVPKKKDNFGLIMNVMMLIGCVFIAGLLMTRFL